MHRVPPSNRPPPPPRPAVVKTKRPPKHVEEKARLTKAGVSEEEMNAERVELPHEHNRAEHEETAQKHAEALGWAPDSHGEAAEKKAEKEEALAESQRDQDEQQGQRQVKQPLKTVTESQKSEQNKQGLQQTTAKKDEFQKQTAQQQAVQQMKMKSGLTDLGSARLGATESVSAVKTTDAVREAQERALKSGKVDAFTLLNQAQPHGTFFKEDYEREGHNEEQEDPALRAAVEECIRQLFGVRGIMRVGPGRNQSNESVIVIVVGQGFGEASMRSIPQEVQKFPTLLALPYDVLPLKKER